MFYTEAAKKGGQGRLFMKQVQRSNPLRYILGTEGTSVSRTGKAPASWSPVLAGDTDKEKEREEKKRRRRIGRREIKRFRIEMKSAGKIRRRSVRRAPPGDPDCAEG